MGFAIENLLKGILIFDKPELVNTGALAKQIKTHNLQSLAIRIPDLCLTEDLTNFLKVLSEAIPDWGRYPCPLGFQQIRDEVEYSKKMTETYDELRKMLRNLLIGRLKEGWISGLENEKTNVKIISMSGEEH